jgi:hypothetical protein
MRHRAARRDKNEPEIIKALREAGASVYQLDDTGLPDLLVGIMGVTILIEVKSDGGKLTPPQQHFFDNWKGQAYVVRTISDVERLLTGLASQAVPQM